MKTATMVGETCDRCGKVIHVGDWPFCDHGTPTLVVHQDSIPGGIVIRNLGPTPVRFDSSTEWRRAVKRAGLVQADGNRFLTNAHE